MDGWAPLHHSPSAFICGDGAVAGKALNKKFFSYVYQCEGGNGNSASGDGYKYRGHGAILLTGKDNYNRVGKKCNNLFGTSYDWVANPDLVASDVQAYIYSAIAYILVAFSNLSELNTTDVTAVTTKINSKLLGLTERKAKFETLIQTNYKCNH